jgi:hypothetical protein
MAWASFAKLRQIISLPLKYRYGVCLCSNH